MLRISKYFVCCATIILTINSLNAQEVIGEVKLPEGQSADYFGSPFAIDNNWLFITGGGAAPILCLSIKMKIITGNINKQFPLLISMILAQALMFMMTGP